MHYPDLSPYKYNLPRPLAGVVNIGWLDNDHPFERGIVPEGFSERLKWAMSALSVNRMRGFHVCDMCASKGLIQYDEPIWLMGESRLMLGSAELWVPGQGERIYAAPNLIHHYVETHGYVPP